MSIPTDDNQYTLLLARLHALETELAALREEVREIKDELHEAWLGGND